MTPEQLNQDIKAFLIGAAMLTILGSIVGGWVYAMVTYKYFVVALVAGVVLFGLGHVSYILGREYLQNNHKWRW